MAYVSDRFNFIESPTTIHLFMLDHAIMRETCANFTLSTVRRDDWRLDSEYDGCILVSFR
jgi:hypothetical protein